MMPSRAGGDAPDRRLLRGDWIDRTGVENLDHVGQGQSDSPRAGPDQEPGPGHDDRLRLSSSVTSAAIRPTGTTCRAPPAWRAALGIP
jgi:hypothetical protein